MGFGEEYPSVYITRRFIKDGSKYFGPYANPGSAKEMVDFIKSRFKIRQCRNFKSNKRVCLNYHIGRCLGPCANDVSKEDYQKQIDQIIMLLEGKTGSVKKELEKEMEQAAISQRYEEAATLRDKIQAIENLSQKQKVSNVVTNDIDVIGIARNELSVCLELFFVRGSKMIGREHYFLNELRDMETGEILSGFIKEYYVGNENIPSKIMIEEEIEDEAVLSEALSESAGRKVEIKSPKKGEKLRFVEMAKNNAKVTLENKAQDKFEILSEIRDKLGLDKLPKKIETFDISNISGANIVAGMCVLQDGKINKSLSRRFKIKTVFGQDDPRCMEEVIERRLRRSIENPKGGFGTLPDLIFVDRWHNSDKGCEICTFSGSDFGEDVVRYFWNG